MAVVSYREIVGRSFQHRFGDAPTAELRYVVTLDDPATATQDILNAVGIAHGSSHPEYAYLLCVEGSVSEADPSPYHATVTYRYEVPQTGSAEFAASPLSRADVWSFSTGGATVPALTYYHGSGNLDRRPLVNAAGDFFENVTCNEAEVRATIVGNRSAFPLADAAAVTNGVNSSTYLGGAAYTWRCSGIGAQQQTEVVSGVEVNFWQVTVELTYRQSGWVLNLPHIGWHYLTGGTPAKEWCFVRDRQTGFDVPAGSPQPLDSSGSLKYTGGSYGPPDIIQRRVNHEIDFSTYFGTPPF